MWLVVGSMAGALRTGFLFLHFRFSGSRGSFTCAFRKDFVSLSVVFSSFKLFKPKCFLSDDVSLLFVISSRHDASLDDADDYVLIVPY